MRRVERIVLGVLVGLLALFAGLVVVGCNENIAVAPKPAEADPQFVLERRSRSDSVPDVYVIRDKVSGKVIYAVPGCGIAVEDK